MSEVYCKQTKAKSELVLSTPTHRIYIYFEHSLIFSYLFSHSCRY
jgi:hypothetical protein